MKKALLATLIGMAGMSSSAVVQAQSINDTFDVVITLTPSCSFTTPPADVAISYTSFGAVPVTSTGGGFAVTCTNGLGYTFGLSNGAVTSGPGPILVTETDAVLNLQYQLRILDSLSASVGGSTGTGGVQNYTIEGQITASQGGTCAGPGACTNAGSANRDWTLTVSY